MAKNVVAVVVAVLAIAACVYVAGRGCRRVRRGKVSDDSKYWVILAMGGRYQCPHCGRQVVMTEEQCKLPKPPPDFACPHCKKAVDVVELMKPKPAAKGDSAGKKR